MSGSGRCRTCGRTFPGSDRYELCAACTGKRLAERRVREVVEKLLPAGHYENRWREYRAGSTAGEPGRSLVIAIGGPKSGVWYDHSGGRGGDLIDLIACCECGGDKKEGLRRAREWLGEPEREWPRAFARTGSRSSPAQAPRDDGENRKRAEQIWREAMPLRRDDLVTRYLAARKIELEELARLNDGKLPAGLRCHPRLWNAEAQRHYPAMVAAIVGPDGQFLGVHRTWLIEETNGRVRQAPVKAPKKSLGHYHLDGGAGCIRLWRPKWPEATEEDVLAFSEGIEDALTIVKAHPSWRFAAGVSLSALLTTWYPPVISRFVLIEQNDKPGSPAALLLDRVRARFRGKGELRRFRVPREVKDVNELVMRLAQRRED